MHTPEIALPGTNLDLREPPASFERESDVTALCRLFDDRCQSLDGIGSRLRFLHAGSRDLDLQSCAERLSRHGLRLFDRFSRFLDLRSREIRLREDFVRLGLRIRILLLH